METETTTAANPNPKANASKAKPDDDTLMPLNQALKALKARYKWMPTWSLRQAVLSGQVPHLRSSDKKGARYYVKISDLVKVLPGTNVS